MKNSRANKGQFSIIAALLVSVILVTAVISTYTLVRHAPIQDSPKVLTAIGEMNTDIKQILDFTVGYYGSILKVTGNSTYARGLTTSYLSSGLVNIARSHPEWNPSFTLDFDDEDISTCWFMPESYSMGSINILYSLEALGIYGVNFTTSSALNVEMLESASGVARINVTRDNIAPELGLSKENFWFYKYNYDVSTWELVNPTNLVISSNGVYNLTIPSGIDPDSYSVQVEDNRGLIVSAFYSPESVASDSKIPHYTYRFNWGSSEIVDIYNNLNTDTFVIELLQNGTLKWLGQPLELTTSARPIPPVAVKAFRVNATSGVNQQVPFQVEDWASDYMVPLGLSGSDSIFSNTNMLVFLVNNEVENITVWWDGNDTAIQSSYALQNNFNGDVSDTYHISLFNGKIDLDVNIDSSRLVVTSTAGSTSKAEFLRINGERPVFHAGTSCVIYNGSVRAILQQEPEYSSGGATDLYSQLILTLPANTNYYTYTSRIIFVDSTQDRIVNDLSVVQLSAFAGTPLTENGTLGGYPVTSSSTGSFYDQSPTSRDHHWSQFISSSSGAGVMFRDMDNQLYPFDSIFGSDTGAIVVDDLGTRSIEVNPVDLDSVEFKYSLDLAWYGTVVTFSGEPIHPDSGHNGLWVMVEYPPSVTVN